MGKDIISTLAIDKLIERCEQTLEHVLQRLKTTDYVTNLDYTHLSAIDDLLIEAKDIHSEMLRYKRGYEKKIKELKEYEHLSKVKPSKSTVAIATT